MPVERITDPADPRVHDYTGLTDLALRTRREPAEGLYLAESEKVIRRALGAGHRPRSFLMAERWLTDLGDVVVPSEGQVGPIEIDWEMDVPDTVEDQLAWLRDAGFEAETAAVRIDLAVFRARLNGR